MHGQVDLTHNGASLMDTPNAIGEMRSSNDVLGDRDALWNRIGEDGYLYLKCLLNVDAVKAARREIMDRLMSAGILDKDYPAYDGVPLPDAEFDSRSAGGFLPGLARDNVPLDKVIYDGPMMDFYRFFLGGPVRHFDYTWIRCKLPGGELTTNPHYDNVYMGRGTRNLFTSWTPFVDIPYEMGGLMLLEGSHKLEELKATYGSTDVDRYCSNEGDADTIIARARAEGRDLTQDERNSIEWHSTGAYSTDPIDVRNQFKTRWLTAEYEMGDVLVFTMFTMHAASDNHTNRVRLSTDTRYQLASEPADERWIGEDPPKHGIHAKEGVIC
jgi:hypothetical protein